MVVVYSLILNPRVFGAVLLQVVRIACCTMNVSGGKNTYAQNLLNTGNKGNLSLPPFTFCPQSS